MSNRYLKFILLFLGLQVFIILLIFFIYEEGEAWFLKNDEKVFIRNIKSVTAMHDETAEIIFHLLDTTIITKKLEKANSSDIKELSKIRKELYKLLNTKFINIKQHDFTELHFHLSNGNILLRMNKPEKFGDKIININESIRIASKEKKTIHGFETRVNNSGFLNLFPLYSHNKYIGSITMLYSSVSLFKHLRRGSMHVELLENKKTIDKVLLGQDKNRHSESININYLKDNIFNKDMRINKDILKKIKLKLPESLETDMKKANKITQIVNIDGVFYSVIIVPVENIMGVKNSAYVVAYIKNESMNQFYSIIILLFAAFTIINIIANLFIFHTSKTRELKELTETLESRILLAKEENKHQEHIMFTQARSAQMGEMLSMIAHQWRQPLNSISASAIFVSMKKNLNQLTDDEFNIHTQFVQDHTLLMSNTINDFMNFFKPDTVKTRFTIKETISDLHKTITPQLNNRGIIFDINVIDDIEIFGHKNELIHILLNLITNSRDALIEPDIVSKWIKLEVEKKDNNILINVSDNGIGIDEKVIERIFDPYFTTKEEGTGTGIGLYMVKTMLKNGFKGNITINKGKTGVTCFNIIIPDN